MRATLDHEILETTTGPLNLRMNRDSRFSPTMRARPGSCLRIKPDGTVSYHNPNCMKYAAPGSKPFKLPALKPREETPADTFERLKVAIDKRMAKDTYKNVSRYVGRTVWDGWRIASTDGHMALIERGEGTGPAFPVIDISQTHIVASFDNPEFHLAVKRALVMCDERSDKVRLISAPGSVTITSADPQMGTFDESLQVNSGEFWHVAIDGKYLECALGSWPMAFWYRDVDSPVMLEPFDSSWRLVIMPIKDDWAGVEFGETEISNGLGSDSGESKAECVHEIDPISRMEVLETPTCMHCGSEIPDDQLPKTRFLVISWDNDQERAYYHRVLATNEDKALEFVGRINLDALPVSAFTVDELKDAAARLESRTDAEILEDMKTWKNEAQS